MFEPQYVYFTAISLPLLESLPSSTMYILYNIAQAACVMIQKNNIKTECKTADLKVPVNNFKLFSGTLKVAVCLYVCLHAILPSTIILIA